jgi:hypothetical protein
MWIHFVQSIVFHVGYLDFPKSRSVGGLDSFDTLTIIRVSFRSEFIGYLYVRLYIDQMEEYYKYVDGGCRGLF